MGSGWVSLGEKQFEVFMGYEYVRWMTALLQSRVIGKSTWASPLKA